MDNCTRIQVEKEHYDVGKYTDPYRFTSYYYQVEEILNEYKGGRVLIIGKGDGIVPSIISGIIGSDKVRTFDYDEKLAPDYVGNVNNIQTVVNEAYEVTVCCQVLEHIDFNMFEDIICQIANITIRKFILSLPYRRINISIDFDMPKFHHKCFSIDMPRFYEKNVPWKGEHLWEVGTRGKGKKKILDIVNTYFSIQRDYLNPQNTYHYFIICNSRSR